MQFARTFGFPVEDITARFWSSVEKTDACWLWTGRIGKGGYGQMRVKPTGRPFGVMPAHRLAYQLLVGPIPAGMTIDHLCRVKNCVRPEHLEPVTASENTKRRWEAEAQGKTTECRRCGDTISAVFLFCRSCWASADPGKRAAVLAAFEKGKSLPAQTSPAYWAAVEEVARA